MTKNSSSRARNREKLKEHELCGGDGPRRYDRWFREEISLEVIETEIAAFLKVLVSFHLFGKQFQVVFLQLSDEFGKGGPVGCHEVYLDVGGDAKHFLESAVIGCKIIEGKLVPVLPRPGAKLHHPFVYIYRFEKFKHGRLPGKKVYDAAGQHLVIDIDKTDLIPDEPRDPDVVEGVHHDTCCRLHVIGDVGPVRVALAKQELVAEDLLEPVQNGLSADMNLSAFAGVRFMFHLSVAGCRCLYQGPDFLYITYRL